MKFRGLQLNDFQTRAVEAIERGNSVLLSAPTGAGKTLVAEYALETALATGRRVIYTAPIKALTNQKYRDFRRQIGDDVGIMTGDVTINPKAPLQLMTTEIFRNTIFEDESRVADVAYVVFDEVHYMDDLERGTVWEESIIFSPPNIRFICLSATISNIDQLGAWLEEIHGNFEIIKSNKRPVPLRHGLFFPGFGPSRLDSISHLDQLLRKKGTHKRKGRHNIADYVEKHRLLPCLYFCFSRKECEKKAMANFHRDLLSGEERKRLDQTFEEICDLFSIEANDDLEEIRTLARRGVGFHHAGILPVHKELIERLYTTGLIKLLFTTETFALGINMPVKTVVFNQLKKYDGVTFDYIKTRDYLQMAGRAGRQGLDKEGKVFSLVNFSDVNVPALKKVIYGNVEPIRSRFNLSYNTILNLYRRLGRERIIEAYERSFAAYQSAEAGSKKKRERLGRLHRQGIERKLAFLKQVRYVDDDGLLPRGEIAAQITGYEIQLTELIFQGVLENLDEHQINVVLTAIHYDERRGEYNEELPGKVLGPWRRKVRDMVFGLVRKEKELGIQDTCRFPNFNLSCAIWNWSMGVEFDELEQYTSVSPGDRVRTLRMTIQLLRQLKKIALKNTSLPDKLDRALIAINRDVVDARRQLEAG
ncbi:MAG: DEAD/DEAH box helicase [Planctomycetota bacterium]